MKNRAKRGILLERAYIWITFKHRIMLRKAEVRNNLKKCSNQCGGTKEEFENVKKYWRKYHVSVKKYWFDWFGQGEEHYNPYYIPDDIWYQKITPYFNNLMFKRAIADKNLFELLLPDIRHPRTVVKNWAGIYYDGEGHVIDYEKCLELCEQEKKIIIKPTLGGGAGKNIHFYDKSKDSPSKIKEILDYYQYNFIVQEIVEQHEQLSAINESSLNSMRILTIFFEGKVHVLSAILRMGQAGSQVDNVSAGGIQCQIHDNGTLYDRGSDKEGKWLMQHPNGIYFKDVTIPSYKKVIETIEKSQMRIPQFKIIGWDFAIDKEGEPVLIEFNVSPEQNQLTCGPTFGTMTDKILKDVFIKKTLKGSAD